MYVNTTCIYWKYWKYSMVIVNIFSLSLTFITKRLLRLGADATPMPKCLIFRYNIESLASKRHFNQLANYRLSKPNKATWVHIEPSSCSGNHGAVCHSRPIPLLARGVAPSEPDVSEHWVMRMCRKPGSCIWVIPPLLPSDWLPPTDVMALLFSSCSQSCLNPLYIDACIVCIF